MKKVLGLDIGSTSIGWAIVHQPDQDGENQHIAGMGVRIIPLSSDENDEFTKGNAISKNAKRTEKRGARRGMHRYKMRKYLLGKFFGEVNIPIQIDLFKISAVELYGLRDKAVKEQITLSELARILFHLNQKRGYKSNRKANNGEEQQDKETVTTSTIEATEGKKPQKKGYLDLIAEREEMVKTQTVGQYFYQQLLVNPFYRIKENIFMRQSYVNEFNQIWDKQQEYYPDVLTDQNRLIVRDQIIYYQRPLKSQKGLVSVCEFEGKSYKDKRSGYQKEIFSGPKVSPKSSPLFQVSKIWQELNNIEITSFEALKNKGQSAFFSASPTGFDQYGKRKLSLPEKQQLFERLNWGEKLTSKQVLQVLGFKSGHNEYKINLRNEKFMEGNRTLSDIKKVFDKHGLERDDLLQFNLEYDQESRVDPATGEVFVAVKAKKPSQSPSQSFENEPLYKLWHLIYAIDDADALIHTLQQKFDLPRAVAADLSKLDFNKAGYGNMSARALRKILPHLMCGWGYADACEKAGYNHSNSLSKTENEVRELLDKLPLYPKNSLRQPVVEKIINQVVNLINEIIDPANGFVSREERLAPDKFEIRVELARELKQNADERNKAYTQINLQDKKHKAIAEILKKEIGINRPGRNDIERYKLWEEFGGISPYEPTKPISLAALFNQVPGELYDIEHIIPKSRLFDDSFSNKTISPRRLNSGKDAKNQDTAYDFFKNRGEQALLDYVEFVRKHLYRKDGISKTKFNKLMMPGDKIPTDFIDRQLNETRYISREVRGLLEQVCRNVHASSGTVTAKLRHLWGWEDVLMNLQMEKYRKEGLTEVIAYTTNGQTHQVERIKGWTKREDHRHHAIDALTVACTKQGFIQRINSLNAEQTRNEMFAETQNGAYKQKLSLLEKYLIGHRPFDTATVEKAAAHILISFKAGKRVATQSRNRIKQGGAVKLVQQTLTPRGFLHKESVYGRVKQYQKVKLSTRFAQTEAIAHPEVQAQVLAHLAAFGNDAKKAFNAKGLAQFVEKHNYDSVTVFAHEHVIKYKVADLKEKDIPYIVDKAVREKVWEQLKNYNLDPKKAFVENTVWMNEAKQIPIVSVRCRTGLTDLQPLHKNENGEPIDFVSTRNNHHIAIYRDAEGKLYENAVTFWDAFERKKAGLPIVITAPQTVWDLVLDQDIDQQELLATLPKPDWIFVTSLQQNEMFVFGLSEADLETAIAEKNLALISQHLYRVQKIASGDYSFRFHLETKVDDKINEVKNEALSIKLGKMKRITSLSNMKGIKVKVNRVGQLSRA